MLHKMCCRHIFILLLIILKFVDSCVDLLFVVDSNHDEISKSRAIQIAKTLPDELKIRRWVVVSRNDRYVPRVVRNNNELISILSTVNGDYDRFLDVASSEISRRTPTYQPLVILLFSENPVNETMTNMWKMISKAPALHIFRIGRTKKREIISENTQTEFEKLLECGRNRALGIEMQSSKFSGNEIRRKPINPSTTIRPLTSTRDPLVRRLTFYDPKKTLLVDKPTKHTSARVTVTRNIKRMTTSFERTTTSLPRTTTSKFTSTTRPRTTSRSRFTTTKLKKPTTTRKRGTTVHPKFPSSARSATTGTYKTTTRSSKQPFFTTSHPKFSTTRKSIKPTKTTRPRTTRTSSKTTTRPRSTTKATTRPKTTRTSTRTTARPRTIATRKAATSKFSMPKRATTKWKPTTHRTTSTRTPLIKTTMKFPTISRSTTTQPTPSSILPIPPKREIARPHIIHVRSRSVHFALTEKPPPSTIWTPFVTKTTKKFEITTRKPTVPFSCTADVYFLIDLSEGTGDKSQQYLDLAASTISVLPISQKAVRIGLISYSGPGRTQVHVPIDKHDKKDDLIEEMFLMHRHGGTTRTANAIRYATKYFRDLAHPTRHDVKKVLVVFTDGYSQDNPKEAARVARTQGIQTIAVAVHDKLANPDEGQLTDIAGNKNNVLISPSGRNLREKILGNQCSL